MRYAAACLTFVASALLLVLAPARVTGEPERQRVTQECTVRANGDIELLHSVRLPLRSYNTLKRQTKNTNMLLRQLGVQGQSVIYRDAKAEFDDEARSVRVRAVMVGGMKNAGRRWWTAVSNPENQEVIDLADHQVTLLSISKLDGGGEQLVTTRLRFPEGTTHVRWNAKRGRIECELPPVPSEPKGQVDLDVDLDVRPEIMSCFYKLYGRPQFSHLWVARASFHNRSKVMATDLRVRYRIVNYADWSPWQKSPRLYPTQTAVEAYYPIFSHRIRDLTAETPSVLEVEWSYTEPDGTRVERSDTQRITLLGMNHVIYSSMPASEVVTWDELFDHVPLIAATFVSHTDPIVQRFAGMAATVSRGAAAGADDESALRFMRAVYTLMVHNRIAYQWPPGLFKKGVRQHVKYGRDVLRNRAGTCIDLSVLFASTCEAGGLSSFLVVVPGHAFPAVRLPSGKLLPIESTGISIRKDGGALTFEQALQRGDAVMRKSMSAGAYQLCDIQALRRAGVPPPELPELPATVLADWGITLPDDVPPAGGEPAMKTYRSADGVAAITVPAAWRAQPKPGTLAFMAPDDGPIALVTWGPRTARTLEAMAQAVRDDAKANRDRGWRLSGEKRDTLAGLPCFVFGATRKTADETHRALVLLTQTRHADVLLLFAATAEVFEKHAPLVSGIIGSLTLKPAAQPADSLSPLTEFSMGGAVERARPPTASKTYRDPRGRYEIAVPGGWTVVALPDDGVRIRSPDEHATAVLQVADRRYDNAEAYLKAVEAGVLRLSASKKRRSEVTGHGKGVLPGTKVPFASATFIHGRGDTRTREEWICFVAGQRQVSLALSAPSERWDAYKPALVEIFSGLRIAPSRATTKPRPKPKPAAVSVPLVPYRDPAGLFELEVPRSWKISPKPGQLHVEARDGNSLITLAWTRRDGSDHATYVTKARAHLQKLFTRWKELKSVEGTLRGHPVVHLTAEAEDTGTKAFVDAYLLSTPAQHWLMINACPPGRRAAFQPVFGQVARSWLMRDPDGVPALALRPVAGPRQPFVLQVPADWRVRIEGEGFVARAPQADAMVVVRSAPKTHETIDAYAQAVLDRMKARSTDFKIIRQEVREVEGRPVLEARIEDTAGGATWIRDLTATFSETHELVLVRSSLAEAAPKWAGHLARIRETWKPRPAK